ncbi:MAG TPA: hypothetical protein VIL69_15625 [Roseomonas sp.]|jgi:hypothetical protein
MENETVRQDLMPPDYAAGTALSWWAMMASKLAIAALRLPHGALRRLATPLSLGVHAAAFHDHVGGALNTLRFPPWLWESGLVARSGLHVNRLGLSQILAAFAGAGFATRLTNVRHWP